MDKKLLGLIIIFFFTFFTFAFITIFNKPITQLTRAKEELEPSREKSKIFAWPLLSVKADGISESIINVFVISQIDKPVVNKPVKLKTSLGQVKEVEVLTDANGKATFHLTSSTPGIALVQAVVNNAVELEQRISIKFE